LPPPRAKSPCSRERTVEDKNKGGVFDPVTDAIVMPNGDAPLIEAEYPDHGIAARSSPIAPQAGPTDGASIRSTAPILHLRLPTWTTLIAFARAESRLG